MGDRVRGTGARRRWSGALLITTALAVPGWATPTAARASAEIAQAPAVEAEAAVRAFDIPPLPLVDAVAAFGRQSGMQLSADGALVQDATSPGVRGTMTPAEALNRLLAGTGLTWRPVGTNTAVLEKPPADGAMTLGPVTVQGNAAPGHSGGAAVSEGTGSYTTAAVTIGKTEQALREIPQSVSVLTRQQMDDQDMTSVADALRNAPGVSTYGYSAANAFSRGFLMSEQQNGIPRQDGLTDDDSYDLAIYDRLEILRGPSGLLSGSGEPGGVINHVRKRPLDQFALSGSVSAGSWDSYGTTADLTGPLNAAGSVRGRMVAAYRDGGTYYDYGHNERRTVYGVVEADPTPDTTIGLSALHSRKDYVTFWGLPLYADGSLPGRSSFAGIDRGSRNLYDEIGADVTHRLDNDWKVKLATYRQTADFGYYGAYGGSRIDAATGLATMSAGHLDWDYVLEGLDASLSGPLALFGRTHELTVGYTWAMSDSLVGYSYAPDVLVNPLRFHDYAVPASIDSKTRTRNQQAGYYGLARVRLADPLTLILGGRLSDYGSKSRTEGVGATGWSKTGTDADNQFTPHGGVVYDLNRHMTLYASYADIFVPQSETDYQGSTLDPRVGWQVEAGVKGSFYDDRLTAALAAFRLRDQNRATMDSTHFGCGGAGAGTCYLAAGTVESQGFEAEIGGSPLPGLQLTAAYTFTDLKDKSTGLRYGADITPKHLVKVWGNYRLAEAFAGSALEDWSIGAGVIAQSSIATAAIRQDGYAIASARVGYDITESISASLNVENLFDKTYLRMPGYDGFYSTYGEPLNATLTLTAKW